MPLNRQLGWWMSIALAVAQPGGGAARGGIIVRAGHVVDVAYGKSRPSADFACHEAAP